MRIAQVNAAVEGGGAERVARSLHEEYLARGLDSWLLVGNRNVQSPATLEIPNEAFRNPWARSIRRLAGAAARHSGKARDGWWYADRGLRALAQPVRYARVARGHEDFDHPATSHLLELTPEQPELLHLHNLHGAYFDIRALPTLTAAVPSVLTMHDTWFLTGHCAHPFECERWLTGCDTCPHLDRYVPLYADESASNFTLKRRVLAQSRLAIATPSQWLMDMAARSGILDDAVAARVIPNGVDTRVFTPGDRTAARIALALDPDARIIAVAGRDLADNPYKGFDILEAALSMLSDQGVAATVLAIGSDAPARAIGSIELRPVPFVGDSALLARHYRAADLAVHPARAEVLGLSIIEALACGIPVVASAVGGIPEVIEPGSNGLLFPAEDSAALAAHIESLLEDRDLRERLGTFASQDAARRFSLTAQADAYLDYYEDIRSGSRA